MAATIVHDTFIHFLARSAVTSPARVAFAKVRGWPCGNTSGLVCALVGGLRSTVVNRLAASLGITLITIFALARMGMTAFVNAKGVLSTVIGDGGGACVDSRTLLPIAGKALVASTTHTLIIIYSLQNCFNVIFSRSLWQVLGGASGISRTPGGRVVRGQAVIDLCAQHTVARVVCVALAAACARTSFVARCVSIAVTVVVHDNAHFAKVNFIALLSIATVAIHAGADVCARAGLLAFGVVAAVAMVRQAIIGFFTSLPSAEKALLAGAPVGSRPRFNAVCGLATTTMVSFT